MQRKDEPTPDPFCQEPTPAPLPAGAVWFPSAELRGRAAEIGRFLIETYHAPGPTRGHAATLPPVDELVQTYLSQSTTDTNSWRAFEALRARFPTWDAVADAPVEEVEAAIRPGGLSRQKAPRIQAALRRLRDEHGAITLDFLADKPVDEALDYLMSFPGVGRKTASCVLLFSLDMPAMPVDTHVLRVARRLALVPERATADQAHVLLEALVPEEDYYEFHVNFIAHGRRTCIARTPACERCPVLRLCPYGMRVLGMPGEGAY